MFRSLIVVGTLAIGSLLFCGCEPESQPEDDLSDAYRPTVDPDYDAGVTYFNRGQYSDAVVSMTKVLARGPSTYDVPYTGPGNGYVYRTRGFAEYNLHRYANAADDLRTAVHLYIEDDLSANQFLGHTLALLRQYGEAIPVLQHAVELYPKHVHAYTDPPNLDKVHRQVCYDLGRALYMTHKYADAAVALNRAIELRFEEAKSAYYLRGLCYASPDVRRFDEATSDLERAGQLGVTVDKTLLFLVRNRVPDPWYAIASEQLILNGPTVAQRLREELWKVGDANVPPVASSGPTTNVSDDPKSQMQIVREAQSSDGGDSDYVYAVNGDATRTIGCVIVELSRDKQSSVEPKLHVAHLMPAEKVSMTSGASTGKGNNDRTYEIAYAWYE